MTLGDWIGVMVAILIPTFTGLIWGIRRLEMLDGRLNTHEQVCGERYRALTDQSRERFSRVDEHDAEKLRRLEAIEAKLDRLVEAR